MNGRLPPELSVGFDEIDVQHRGILQRIAELSDAVAAGDLALVRASVTALGDAVATHFAEEERFMAETSYPERGKHKTAHDMFLADFAQLASEVERFGLTPVARNGIDVRVPEWTRFHIQVNDVPLGRFLAAKRFRPTDASRSDKPRAS
jgi:hemerythrin